MIQRCTNPSHKSFPRYGGRGITVCDEWLESFEAFASYVGDPPGKEYSIDRIDNDAGYMRGNVKWSTQIEQSRNRRGRRIVCIEGAHMPLSEAIEKHGSGVKYSTAHNRLKRGLSIEKVLAK
jgi:hypothetical protein